MIIVAGCPSAGHRLMAAYFVRAGCTGDGSTNQREDDDIIAAGHSPAVVIRHPGSPDKRLEPAIRRFLEAGWSIDVVYLVREPVAQSRSMERHGISETVAAARIRIQAEMVHGLDVLRRHADRLRWTVLPIEAVWAHPFEVLAALLGELGLRTDNLAEPITVDGVEISPVPYDANAGRYSARPEPVHRPAHGAELVWWPERGLGYYPVRDYPRAYDGEYLNKYAGYAQTELGRRLTAARVELVTKHIGGRFEVCDVGIGCGDFIRHCQDATGYDVNPAAVEWLKGRGWWRDPYSEPVDVVTCWDSLEHIPDPAALISRVGRWAFLSIPIFEGPDHVLRSKHFRRDEHFWYFTRDGLCQWFSALGFELIECNAMEIELGREDIGTFVFRRRY